MLSRFARCLGRRDLVLAGLSIGAFTGLAAAPRARAQAVQLAVLDVTAVAKGYQISKLLRARVDNEKDEKIGSLDDFILTDDQKLIAILQVGGFLGVGGYLVAVPYSELKINDDGRKITLAGASKDALRKLPEFHFRK